MCPVPKEKETPTKTKQNPTKGCLWGEENKKKGKKIKKERNGPKEAIENGILTRKIREKLQHTLCVVHADRRVVIDRRFPQQCIIRVVSAMRTKQSIGYKMVSHGSWSSPIEKTEKQTNKQKKGQSGRQMWYFQKKRDKRTFRNDNSRNNP